MNVGANAGINPDARARRTHPDLRPEDVLSTAESLRWEAGGSFHEKLMETIYADAARIADRAVTRPGEKPQFDLDRTIDKIVTSRVWGFPMMLLLFTIIFWLTITGANIPSSWLATLFLDKIYPALHAGADALRLPWWLSGFFIDGVLSCDRLGNECDAAADGNLLPAIHFIRRFWVFASGCIQPGQYLPKVRRPWETVLEHDDGVWL